MDVQSSVRAGSTETGLSVLGKKPSKQKGDFHNVNVAPRSHFLCFTQVGHASSARTACLYRAAQRRQEWKARQYGCHRSGSHIVGIWTNGWPGGFWPW